MPGIAERFGKFDANAGAKIARDEMHNLRMRQQRQAGPGSEQL
jgi:hypothetical protein